LVVGNTVQLCTGGGSGTGYGAICPVFNQSCGCSAPYPLTRAGIQAAITAGTAACSGSNCNVQSQTMIVIVGGNVVSDGVPLTIPNYITLDMNGNSFSMPNTTASFDMITVLGTQSSTAVPLLSSMVMGNLSLYITPAQAATFVAGQMVLLSGGTWQGVTPGGAHTNRVAQQTAILSAVNSAAGILTLRDPAAYDFLTSLGATITLVTPVIGAGIRNAKLVANKNLGALSRLLVVENVQYFAMDNVQVSGQLVNSMPGTATLDNDHQYRVGGVWVSVAADSTFNRVSSVAFSGADSNVRDISFSGLTSSSVSNIRSARSGGPGPSVMFSVWSRIRTVLVSTPTNVGFRLGTVAYCQVSGVVSTGALAASNGVGFSFGFGSHHNTAKGIVVSGNGYAGITYMGDLDSYNLIEGFSAYTNANQSVVFGTGSNGAVGNALYGGLDTGPIAGFVGNPFDYNVLHHVTNPNGHYIQSVSGKVPAATTDLAVNMQLAWQIHQAAGADDTLNAYVLSPNQANPLSTSGIGGVTHPIGLS